MSQVYEMLGTTLEFEQGKTYSAEELAAAGCDVAWLEKTKTIRPVGFITQGEPRSEAENAAIVAELQAKLEKAEDEAEEHRRDKRELQKEIDRLKAGHETGARQLREAIARAQKAEAELLLLKDRAKSA